MHTNSQNWWKCSPKREDALKKKQELKIRNLDLPLDTGVTNTKIKLLCPARWTARAKSLHSIASSYQAIQDMLEWCKESKNARDSEIWARAGGVAKKMDRLHFLYGRSSSVHVGDWSLITSVLNCRVHSYVLHMHRKLQSWWFALSVAYALTNMLNSFTTR